MTLVNDNRIIGQERISYTINHNYKEMEEYREVVLWVRRASQPNFPTYDSLVRELYYFERWIKGLSP